MYRGSLAIVAVATTLVSLAGSQSIDPNTVPISTRNTWCTNQIAACPLICTQETQGSAATYANTCDPTTLQYNCVCGNGLAPNVSEYSQTVPYYVCTQANTNCQSNCGTDSSCQAACVQNRPCGAQNPKRVNTTTTMATTTSMTAATGSRDASGSTVYTGFGGSSATSSSSSSGSSSSSSRSGAASIIVDMGQLYGLAVVATGIFAGATLLL